MPSEKGSTRERSLVEGLSQHSSATQQASASIHFLRALHAAFPTTAVNTDCLLQQQGKETRLRRVFKRSKFCAAFDTARQDFITFTLEVGKSIVPPTSTLDEARLFFEGNRADGRVAQYTKHAYDEIEVDSLAKVCLPSDFVWQTDTAQSRSYNVAFFAKQGDGQTVPVRREPDTPPMRRASSAASVDSPRSAKSTSSAAHYPEGASHYVIGEAYNAISSLLPPFQKLLQVERTLRFLLVKENCTRISDCVAGALFIGFFDEHARTRMAQMLQHYAAALPLLSELQSNRRFLAINMPQHSTTAVEQMRAERATERVILKMERQQQVQTQQQKEMQQQIVEMQLQMQMQQQKEMRLQLELQQQKEMQQHIVEMQLQKEMQLQLELQQQKEMQQQKEVQQQKEMQQRMEMQQQKEVQQRMEMQQHLKMQLQMEMQQQLLEMQQRMEMQWQMRMQQQMHMQQQNEVQQ